VLRQLEDAPRGMLSGELVTTRVLVEKEVALALDSEIVV
jgi:hypothetical protein